MNIRNGVSAHVNASVNVNFNVSINVDVSARLGVYGGGGDSVDTD